MAKFLSQFKGERGKNAAPAGQVKKEEDLRDPEREHATEKPRPCHRNGNRESRTRS